MVPMIGASAAIAASWRRRVRFAFAPGGSLSGRRGPLPDHMPAQGLGEAFRDPACSASWASGSPPISSSASAVTMPGAEDGEVAWQAHLGGFFAGLLLFSFFDPVGRRLPREENRRPELP